MHTAVGIGQGVKDHVVDHLHIAHLAAATDLIVHQIRGAGHDLSTTGGDQIGLTGGDGGSSIHHGLHAGATDHIQRVGRNFHRNTGSDGHLSAGALTQTSGQHITHHHFVQPLGLDIGSSQGSLQHLAAQLGSGGILQSAQHGADGTTLCSNNIYLAHIFIPPFFIFPEAC